MRFFIKIFKMLELDKLIEYTLIFKLTDHNKNDSNSTKYKTLINLGNIGE